MPDSALFRCAPVLAGFEQQTVAISIYLGLGLSSPCTDSALITPVYRASDKLFCPLVLASILIFRIPTSCTTASTCALTCNETFDTG